MRVKKAFKMAIDFVMTALLLVLMAYMLTGQQIHEYVGSLMFVLFIAHNMLNIRWYRNLFKGTYTLLRTVRTIINLLVFAAMIGLMVSGIMMSHYVFDFLPISGGMSFARTLHMFCAYWGFMLMSVHLGMHWGMIMGMVGKIPGTQKGTPLRTFMLRAGATAIAVFGLCSFKKHKLLSYMLLKTRFAYFDFEQPAYSFFIDYIAIMGFWMFLAYYASGLLQKTLKRNKNKTVMK